ncbi:MAG: hypothetical protein A2148_11880 [Chloroflexi bacterium RBG_16_68_14]|nr:MAG: hypothetical protein A2148_11880 [Chloroflexi bacterium RBG_16_68_14]
MDLLALGAAGSLMVTVMAFALAFFSGAAASSQIRGRLEGALGGTSVVQGASVVTLRKSRSPLGAYQSIISGAWLQRMERELRLADSQLQPIDLVAMRVALAGLGLALPYLFLDGVLGMLGAMAAALVGFQLPQIWLGRRRASRQKKLEEQLPDALTYVANSLKAGFGLMQSLSMAADQLEHPIATELAQVVHETNVGSSMEEAFLALSERNGNYDLDLVVTAVLVQRSAGGNLAEILGTVTETMRERTRIRGEISTLTAQQSLTGVVIGLLPVGVGAMFLLVSPDYIMLLFKETIGQVLLGVAALLEAVGIFIIRRILDIEV